LRFCGYALAHGFHESALLELARRFGPVTLDPRHPYAVRCISPQDLAMANPNTLSSRYGLGPFPFHTDVAHWRCPANIVFLLCSEPGGGHRPSYVTDSHGWQLSREAWDLLSAAVWKTGHVRPFLCTAVRRRAGETIVRYDTGSMSPRSTRAEKAAQLLRDHLATAPSVRINWMPGDLLILDNHRALHARGSSPRPDPERCISRVLVGGSHEGVGLRADVA
jgi:L-asparagine oxygenase